MEIDVFWASLGAGEGVQGTFPTGWEAAGGGGLWAWAARASLPNSRGVGRTERKSQQEEPPSSRDGRGHGEGSSLQSQVEGEELRCALVLCLPCQRASGGAPLALWGPELPACRSYLGLASLQRQVPARQGGPGSGRVGTAPFLSSAGHMPLANPFSALTRGQSPAEPVLPRGSVLFTGPGGTRDK